MRIAYEVNFINFSDSVRVEFAYEIIVNVHVLVSVDFWYCDSLWLVSFRQLFDAFLSVGGVVLKRPRIRNFLSIHAETTVRFNFDNNHRLEDVLGCCHFHNLQEGWSLVVVQFIVGYPKFVN